MKQLPTWFLSFAKGLSSKLASLCFLLIMFSCQQSEDISTKQLVDVNVSVSGFEITSTQDGPLSAPRRASGKTAADAKVTRICLSVFDASNKLDTTIVQDKNTDAATFGQAMSFRLPVGTYKFVAVAYKATTDAPAITISSPTEVSFGAIGVPVPTYTTVQNVTIAGNTTQNVSIDMGTRDNAVLKIKITDATPSNVESFRITINPASSVAANLQINPTTGFSVADYKYTSTWSKTADKMVTFTNYAMGLSLLLTSDPQQVDVLLEALNAEGTAIYSRTLENVGIQRAHTVTAKGTFFSPTAGIGLAFDDTDTPDNVSLD